MESIHGADVHACLVGARLDSREMSTVTVEELKAYIVSTYEPADGVYRRILTYVDQSQGSSNIELYVRRRHEAANGADRRLAEHAMRGHQRAWASRGRRPRAARRAIRPHKTA